MRAIQTFILISIVLLFSPVARASDCIDWGKVMTKYEISSQPSWKITVLLQPFENFTKLAGDDWLATGIPYLLSDYLRTSEGINTLFGPTAKYDPNSAKAAYTVNGMYQHVDGRLRMFIKLMEGNGLTKQLQVDIAYPQNKQFFTSLSDAALELMAIISPPYDKDALKTKREATASLPSYENYIRGLLSYWSFEPVQMDVARMWFDESKKADINYMNAYQGNVDVYTFLAMYNKQDKKNFADYIEKAGKEIQDMQRFSRRLPPPDRPKRYTIKMKYKIVPVSNRFLLGHASFVAGLDAASQQKWSDAARFFEESVGQVPEDAITWYQLSKMRDRAGDKSGAAQARAKAFELNKCLQ